MAKRLGMNDFLQRLCETQPVQWALAYAAAACVLLQGLVAQFAWSDAARRGIAIVLVIGSL